MTNELETSLTEENELSLALGDKVKLEGKATHSAADCAPRKARRLRSLIIGKNVDLAISILAAQRRSGSVQAIKLIKSALAQLSPEYRKAARVVDLRVNEGPKRIKYMPRAQGRATPMRKRTSHLTVTLIA
jgi:large subunit ribosomal protein L22